MTRLRARAGATMVMVAILMTALLGMAAMAIDLSRLFVMKEQLQTSADAGALAGAVELSHGELDELVGTAVGYARLNHVEQGPPPVGSGDVDVGSWDFAAGSFSPVAEANWTTAPVNAVRLTTHHTASLTFGRVFDMVTTSLRATSVAGVGYVSEARCVKPWAMSYQDLLDALFGEGARSALSYDLQPSDINVLAQVDILKGNTAPFAPGDIGQLRFGSGDYSENIEECSDAIVRPGDVLAAEPGGGSGQTRGPLWRFCNEHGGATGSPNGNGAFTCIGRPKVKVVLWDTMESKKGKGGGATVTYRMKYIGAVAITGFRPTTPYVSGYFTTLASDGALSSEPSPLTRVVLVR